MTMTQQKRTYIKNKSDIVNGIKRALDETESAQTIPHDEVMRRIRRRIARIASITKRTPRGKHSHEQRSRVTPRLP
jgi:hypothetical protein